MRRDHATHKLRLATAAAAMCFIAAECFAGDELKELPGEYYLKAGDRYEDTKLTISVWKDGKTLVIESPILPHTSTCVVDGKNVVLPDLSGDIRARRFLDRLLLNVDGVVHEFVRLRPARKLLCLAYSSKAPVGANGPAIDSYCTVDLDDVILDIAGKGKTKVLTDGSRFFLPGFNSMATLGGGQIRISNQEVLTIWQPGKWNWRGENGKAVVHVKSEEGRLVFVDSHGRRWTAEWARRNGPNHFVARGGSAPQGVYTVSRREVRFNDVWRAE